MTSDLPALSARLRAAEAATADDVLLALCRAFAGHDDVRHWLFELGGDPRTSIDAAVKVAQAVGPQLSWGIRKSGYGATDAELWDPCRTPGRGNLARVCLDSGDPALALCLALVEWKVKHG